MRWVDPAAPMGTGSFALLCWGKISSGKIKSYFHTVCLQPFKGMFVVSFRSPCFSGESDLTAVLLQLSRGYSSQEGEGPRVKGDLIASHWCGGCFIFLDSVIWSFETGTDGLVRQESSAVMVITYLIKEDKTLNKDLIKDWNCGLGGMDGCLATYRLFNWR